MLGPSSDDPHPMKGFPQVGFLKPLVKNPNIVVVGDAPAYSIVGGNSAKVIKQRFPDEVVNELLAIRWWNWPVDKTTRNLPAIVGADVLALKNAE